MYALILSVTPIISFFPGQNMYQAISSLPTLKSLPEYTRGRQFFCGGDEENRRKLPQIDKILTGFPGRLLLFMLCQIFPDHIHPTFTAWTILIEEAYQCMPKSIVRCLSIELTNNVRCFLQNQIDLRRAATIASRSLILTTLGGTSWSSSGSLGEFLRRVGAGGF